MGDQKDKKDIKDSPGPIPVKDSPGPIPEGWVLYTKFRKDGIEVKTYFCPATEQEFYTYEDLMRYVRYAKAAKLSIYSPMLKECRTLLQGDGNKSSLVLWM
ncbi:hypothetical protein GOBAR_DD21185 [Gossypium barbadense]|nr:hypothetical protein GOBAR_DD21185 [Gossypium barbadense]